MSKLNLNLSQWAAGRSPYGGWAVFKNGREISYLDCLPLTFPTACLAARWFAHRERRGKRVPPYDRYDPATRTVVSEPTIPHRDLRTIS